LTDHERREIELEENLRRKALTSYERAQDLAALAETAAAILKTSPPLYPPSWRKKTRMAGSRNTRLPKNLRRKDLTQAERSKHLVALADTAAEIDRAEFRPTMGRKSR